LAGRGKVGPHRRSIKILATTFRYHNLAVAVALSRGPPRGENMHKSARGQEQPAPVPRPDPADQRAATRHTLLIRAAKLILGEAEFLCILRDASETGVRLRLFHDLPVVSDMLLELQNEERHAVEAVWRDGERMGLRFRQQIDVHRLIEMPAPFNRRPIRVRLNVPGVICVGEDTVMCSIRDLSQHGAKIACSRSFALDQRVHLVAPGMPKVPAKIRWRRNDQLGLSFEMTFQLGELAMIVAGFHAEAATPLRAPSMPTA
jgi:hypothetical protein